MQETPQDISGEGQQIGNYRLLNLLGRGMASEVYRAEHVQTGQQVAIKILNGYWSAQDIQKFLARASVLTHLHHPHIVQVFEFGVEQRTAFLVMEYAPHGTLRTLHPRGTRLPLPQVISYVRQIASALHYVHQHNLIHRDIKPHNMLLSTQEHIVLSDFGIAVVSQSIAPFHQTFDEFEGTAPYSAPEQLLGKPRRSSDQYSLGIVVYEWLCGTWPFSGSFETIVQHHLFEAPPPLRTHVDTLPASVEQVVLKTLAKDPDDRFPDILSFAAALHNASLSLLPHTSKQATPLSPLSTSEHNVPATPPLTDEESIQKMKQRQFKSPLPFSTHE